MINAMISVRSDSTRLPGKCFKRLPTGRDVLTHVIERCWAFGLNPLVATTMLDSDDVVVATARAAGARVYRGDVDDKMRRWLLAANEHDVDDFVVVDCDDPLFDENLTKMSYAMLRSCAGCDFVLPDMRAYLGSHGMSVAVDALDVAVRSKTSDKTEMVQKHIHPSARVVQLDVPDVSQVEHDLRLTLDYDEDFLVITTVIGDLGPHARRREIIDYFEVRPEIRALNEFRNVAWRLKQAST